MKKRTLEEDVKAMAQCKYNHGYLPKEEYEIFYNKTYIPCLDEIKKDYFISEKELEDKILLSQLEYAILIVNKENESKK